MKNGLAVFLLQAATFCFAQRHEVGVTEHAELSDSKCAQNSSPFHREVLQRLSKTGRDLWKSTPLAKLLDDYIEVLSPGSYSSSYGNKFQSFSNDGLNAYLMRLLNQDSLLRRRAYSTYDEIHRLILSANPSKTHPEQNLMDDLKSLSGGKLNSGWVWKVALKHARGDTLQAMRILGVCGHDWVFNAPAISVKTPEDKEYCRRHNQRDGSCVLDCPDFDDSFFYTPKSLDIDADISSKLRQQIHDAYAKVRELTGSKRYEPRTKYYHVYAAAFISCEMIKRGHDPNLVVFLQQALAWAYRTVMVDKYYSFDAKPNVCYYDPVTADAGELIRRWTGGGIHVSLPGFSASTPRTNLRFPVPEALDNNPQWITMIRPKGWTEERFKKAKALFNLIMLDWDWTMAQHRAGAEFAAKNCLPSKDSSHQIRAEKGL